MNLAGKDLRIKLAQVRLCVITDKKLSRGRSFVQVTQAAIRGGAEMIQLRDKELPDGPFFREALKLRALTREAGVLFVIDDRVDVALSVGADAIHLGEQDLPLEEARRLVGPKMILGASARTPAGVKKAGEAGADYLGVGAVFATGTKGDATYVGTERITRLRPLVKIPILAIGGITEDNAGQAIQAGADAVAAIGAVMSAEDIADATARLLHRVRRARGEV